MRLTLTFLAGVALVGCSSGQGSVGTPPPPSADPRSPSSTSPSTAPTVLPSAAGPEPQASSAPEPTPPPKPNLPEALPTGTKVLHVGDSMADALGKSLKIELKKRGITNVLDATEATYIPQWAGFKMGFRSTMKRHDPDMVIITLGGNETAMPDPSIRADPVRRLVKQVGDKPCIWIAAPLWPGAPNTGIMNVIRDNCAPCVYVDTNDFIKTGALPDLKRTGDKVHPTIPERRRWAKFMVRWLLHNRDPNGKRVWDFKAATEAPPAKSEAWLTDHDL